MKIYWERILIDEVPSRPEGGRKGIELFSRLVGVELSGAGNSLSVVPLYMPLVRVLCQAGQVRIEITDWQRPRAYITLQRRQPYVHLFYFPWWILDKEANGD
jgi:hypothetical protein